jgi:hypothetical protein
MRWGMLNPPVYNLSRDTIFPPSMVTKTISGEYPNRGETKGPKRDMAIFITSLLRKGRANPNLPLEKRKIPIISIYYVKRGRER